MPPVAPESASVIVESAFVGAESSVAVPMAAALLAEPEIAALLCAAELVDAESAVEPMTAAVGESAADNSIELVPAAAEVDEVAELERFVPLAAVVNHLNPCPFVHYLNPFALTMNLVSSMNFLSFKYLT